MDVVWCMIGMMSVGKDEMGCPWRENFLGLLVLDIVGYAVI